MPQRSTLSHNRPHRARHIYLVNVGVNTSHRLKSPIYSDGRFEFVPIPEYDAAQDKRVSSSEAVQSVRYRDLYGYNSPEPLLSLFPLAVQAIYADQIVHNDPHLGNASNGDSTFDDFSYGDVPLVNPRASTLRHAQVGDWLFFIANLADYDADQHRFSGKRALYLIALIEIGHVLEYLPRDLPGAPTSTLRDRDTRETHQLEAYASNAHVNRLLRLPDFYHDQPFSIFQGTARSTRFTHAVELTPELCRSCFTDKDGQPIDDTKFRSFTACIGAYTRSVRVQYTLDDAADRRRFHTFRDQIAEQTSIPNLPE